MKMYQDFSKGKYVRPVILELGGKNPAIVSKNADLERAAIGIVLNQHMQKLVAQHTLQPFVQNARRL